MATVDNPRRSASVPKGKRLAPRKTRKIAKPDMKAFAERCLAFQGEQFGDRVAPDSMKLLDDMRADRS